MTRVLQLLGISFLFWHQLFSATAQDTGSSSNKLLYAKAVLRAARGDVQRSNNGTEWTRFKVGEFVHEGTTIRTTGESMAFLFLGQNGGPVCLKPNTVLRFETFVLSHSNENWIPKTVLDLKSGQISSEGIVKDLAGLTYQIKTHAAIAKVSGGNYVICESGRLAVFAGAATIDCATESYSIAAGEFFDPLKRTVRLLRIAEDPVRSRHSAVSAGHEQYQIGESFRRIHDGWPNLPGSVFGPFSNGKPGESEPEFQCEDSL